jgi:hypothetical protein
MRQVAARAVVSLEKITKSVVYDQGEFLGYELVEYLNYQT